MKRLVARAEGRLLDKKKDDRLTFGQLADWFLTLPEIKRKASYERDKRSVVKLKEFFKTKVASQVTAELVGKYQEARQAEESYRGGNTKPATINREVACLKTMFNKAVDNGKLEKNPMRGVKLLDENNERERVLSAEEWQEYKAHCPAWYLPIACTAYHTAMRKGEILNLKVSRLDPDEGFIKLRAEDCKTKKGRSVPIHSEMTEVLKDALKIRHLNCDLVFHLNGRRITDHELRVAHEAVCKEAGIEGFVFHDFRHTCINNWRKAGHDYFKIMKASGHKTVSVFKRYNMVDDSELRTLNSSMDTTVDTSIQKGKEKEVGSVA